MIEKKRTRWEEIQDRPSEYPPAPHQHGDADLTGIDWSKVQNKPFVTPLQTKTFYVTPDNFLGELKKASSGFQNIYYLEPGEYTISENVTLPFCAYIHIIGKTANPDDVIIKPSLYTYGSYSTTYKIFMPLGTLTVASVTFDIDLVCENCDAHAGILAFSRRAPWSATSTAMIGMGQLLLYYVVLNINSEKVYPVVVRDFGTLFLMMKGVTVNVGDDIDGFIVDANYSRLMEYDFSTTINLGANATFSITRPNTTGSWVVRA